MFLDDELVGLNARLGTSGFGLGLRYEVLFCGELGSLGLPIVLQPHFFSFLSSWGLGSRDLFFSLALLYSIDFGVGIGLVIVGFGKKGRL